MTAIVPPYLSSFFFFPPKSDPTTEVEELSSSLCDSEGDLEGSILTWEEMEWRLSGDSVFLVEVEREEVCSQSGHHLILLPALLSYQEARSACAKLGEAALGGPRDPASLSDLTSWYGRSLLSCSSVWTPYSDQQQEGVFINENTGDIMRQISSLTLLQLFSKLFNDCQ